MPLNTTFLDLVKFRGMEGRDILNEVFRSNPAFTGTDLYGNKIPIASTTIPKDRFEAMYRIGNPDIDPFRIYNRGFGTSQGQYEQRRFETTIAGQYYNIDAALMKTDAEAAAKYLAARCTDILDATISAMEKQFFYGGQKDNAQKNSDPSKLGYQGLQMLIDPTMTFDAGGTGASAKLTSAYLIDFNDRHGVTWIFGENGAMEFTDPIELLEDDDTDPEKKRKLPVIQSHFEFYPGVAFLSRYAASRIVNIDTQTAFTTAKNRNAFTDETIATALAKWPVGAPNAIIMTKAAGMMLAASRTVTTLVGAGAGGADIPIQSGFVSLPKEHNGIPIAYSDALLNTEKKVTFSA
jgi:hypothetical protein